MGRPKKAPAAAPPAPSLPDIDDTDDVGLNKHDQDLFDNLQSFLAAKSAPGGNAAAALNSNAKAKPTPAAKSAQPGALPLKRITPGGQTSAQKAGQAAAGGSKAPPLVEGSARGTSGATKRKAEASAAAVAAGLGARKQARTTTAGGAGGSGSAAATDAPLPTDRDGVPTLEGLRSWVSGRVAALQERLSVSLGQQCSKAIEDGYHRVNAAVQSHHSAVTAMLTASSEALEAARGQHEAVLGDIGALRDGLLEEVDAARGELQAAVRADVVGPMQAGIASLQAKYKIG